MSQSSQSQPPYVHNIRSHIREDGSVHCDHGRVPLLTSFTAKNPDRPFFTCRLQRDDKNRCKFFAWLDEIRDQEDWHEERFRKAYQYHPPEDGPAVTETPRKRRTPPSSDPGPSVPSKRICHVRPEEDYIISDEEFFTSPPTRATGPTTPTPLNRGDARIHPRLPLTPSSPSTRRTHTAVSPTREQAVRRPQLSHLHNFDDVADLSPLSLTPNFQVLQAAHSLPARVNSADEVEEIISITNNVTMDFVRKLERRSIASQRASDAKTARIQQLETELTSSHREYERSQQQISSLNREIERFQQEIIKLTTENNKLRSSENENA